jgi:hypothetical protein
MTSGGVEKLITAATAGFAKRRKNTTNKKPLQGRWGIKINIHYSFLKANFQDLV